MNHLVHICYSDYPPEQNAKEGVYSLSLYVLGSRLIPFLESASLNSNMSYFTPPRENWLSYDGGQAR